LGPLESGPFLGRGCFFTAFPWTVVAVPNGFATGVATAQSRGRGQGLLRLLNLTVAD
jgi:hypothetical protein